MKLIDAIRAKRLRQLGVDARPAEEDPPAERGPRAQASGPWRVRALRGRAPRAASRRCAPPRSGSRGRSAARLGGTGRRVARGSPRCFEEARLADARLPGRLDAPRAARRLHPDGACLPDKGAAAGAAELPRGAPRHALLAREAEVRRLRGGGRVVDGSSEACISEAAEPPPRSGVGAGARGGRRTSPTLWASTFRARGRC